jgi:hypothetical protein
MTDQFEWTEHAGTVAVERVLIAGAWRIQRGWFVHPNGRTRVPITAEVLKDHGHLDDVAPPIEGATA